MDDSARTARVQGLYGRLEHYDPSQLVFQVMEVAGEQSYLRHGVDVGKGDVVLDVGANVGVAAAFFAGHCGAASVHCFEPVEPLCTLLRDNLADLPACTVHEYGLSSKPGHAQITYYPHSAAMSSLYADPDRDRATALTVLGNFGYSAEDAEQSLDGRYAAQTMACELRTLSSVLSMEQIAHVDLVKIDVERAELDVLGGIEQSDWQKIEQLAIEVHDEAGRAAAIDEMLTQRGFHVAIDQDPAMLGTSVRMLYATRR